MLSVRRRGFSALLGAGVAALLLPVALAAPALASPAAASPAVVTSSALVTSPAPPTTAVVPSAGQRANPYVPEGAVWSQQYFSSGSGAQRAELHADILRPKNLPKNAKTPVILSIGPYFSHFGSVGDENKTQAGPSTRFDDLVTGGKLMERGYTFVMVDLRGFGGSTGCLDWLGPGEQTDVRAALDWAAKQPWSNGKVGMYGKSYDASTGLIGLGSGAAGLKAVVAQEPVYDAYRYLYTNGIARSNHLYTPQAYDGISQLPPVGGALGDDAHYAKNAGYEQEHPECVQRNDALTQNPDHRAGFWQARNLLTPARGSKVPLFLTQGFIEDNTRPEGVQELIGGLRGPVHAWLGQWPHVRGNDTDENGVLQMGRAGWFDEVMRFYDQQLKGIVPAVKDPAFAIEGSDGKWREQNSWPQAQQYSTVSLRPGSYSAALNHDGDVELLATASQQGVQSAKQNPAKQDIESLGSVEAAPVKPQPAGGQLNGLWTESAALRQPVRITGTPALLVNTQAPPGATLGVELYDLAADGKGVLIDSIQTALPASRGPATAQRTRVELRSLDWTLAPGHRLAVRIGGAVGDQKVLLKSAKLLLALQSTRFDRPTQGQRSPFLDQYLSWYAAQLPRLGPSFQLPRL